MTVILVGMAVSVRRGCGVRSRRWAYLGGCQEAVDVAGELVRELEQEPVACVGVDAQFGVREVPGEQVRVNGRDHDVAVAVGDQGGLGDSGQSREFGRIRYGPVA